MVRSPVALGAAALVLGCGSKDEPAPAAVAEVAPPAAAAPAPAASPGVTELPSFEPGDGQHLDGDAPAPSQPRPRVRGARTIGILLRSSPSGAVVAVDGQSVGRTPAFWEGEATGGQRDFTFALPGYAVARYRFVPVTSGVVHGWLEPLANRDEAPIGAPVPGAPSVDAPVPGAPSVDAPAPGAPSVGAPARAPQPVTLPSSPVVAPDAAPSPAIAPAPAAPAPVAAPPPAPAAAPAPATPGAASAPPAAPPSAASSAR